jgi:hypothetical protein
MTNPVMLTARSRAESSDEAWWSAGPELVVVNTDAPQPRQVAKGSPSGPTDPPVAASDGVTEEGSRTHAMVDVGQAGREIP